MKFIQNHFLIFLIAIICFYSCSNDKKSQHKFTNELIKETSPYLLQHAHNPVNWKAWNNKTLEEAKEEKKLIVISIGYAACHWCHVMEKESFEDSLVAKTMNKDFINIKVDREERPDVDKVYMNAVQLMTGNGGWPLNVIALPDGRPIWGGTYFTKNQWQNVLKQIAESYKNNPKKLYDFADKLEKGIKDLDLVEVNSEKPDFTKSFVEDEVKKWQENLDETYGGSNKPPKFMMPNNYQFLLRFAHQNDNKIVMNHLENTLQKMAFGGIFDQINGGFSRYSTDKKWHIPHFEKMLYDNAQLVSLYSKAYQLTKNEIYKNVVFETLDFIKNDLTSKEGMFYSSLDADSFTSENKLEEGAFYTWTKVELQSILKTDFELFSKYYNINNFGLWEHNKYVFIKNVDDKTFCETNNISISDLKSKKNTWKELLRKTQQKRSKPRLDDKSLTSWNALMITGYIDAYNVFNKNEYLEIATKNAKFIADNLMSKNGKLFHNYKNGKITINGFLEDYSATAEAFIKLYETTSNEIWLQKANDLVKYAIEYFYDSKSKMFFFTSKEDATLASKSIEIHDNVIPASNSVMAKNLFLLSHHLNNNDYKEKAALMLNNIKPQINGNASSFSNWLDLMMNYTNNYYEVVIVGDKAKAKKAKLKQYYLPNILLSISEKESNLPLLENRFIEDETYMYVCVNNSCKLPVTTIIETLKLIEN